jgi:SOS-response transcriptional repressor LexA
MARTYDDDNPYRKEIVKAIKQFWQAHKYAPTNRDIANKVGMIRNGKTASTSVIDYHLGVLEKQGIVERDGFPRTIRLTNMGIYFVEEEE